MYMRMVNWLFLSRVGYDVVSEGGVPGAQAWLTSFNIPHVSCVDNINTHLGRSKSLLHRNNIPKLRSLSYVITVASYV